MDNNMQSEATDIMIRQNKGISIVKGIASSFIWGLGQVFNRQFGKALFFFAFFALLLGIELGTSSYFTEVDPYDKIIGQDFDPSLANSFHEKYLFNKAFNDLDPIEEYESYYEQVTQDGEFTNEELYQYLALEMTANGLNEDTKKYDLTPLAEQFQIYMSEWYSKPGNTNNMQDFTRMLVEIYFYSQPELRDNFEDSFYNFFYDRAGFFVRGIWSIITLGVTRSYTIVQHAQFDALQPDGHYILTNVPIRGHYSTNLLLEGLISTLILLYFAIIWIWNIRDAFKTSNQIQREGKVPNERQYFKELYHNSFEYIVLMPAFFLITVISIMPIIFGFLIAFTNYSDSHLIHVSWVGFENFKRLGRYTSADTIPFGKTFPKVFGWTLVWAIFSTLTCYFAGFIQAIILNNKRVVGRKLWRSLLILPWAIPALISQMVLKIMFNDKGVVNTFLRHIGVYDLLHKVGMLGRDANSISTFWERLTWLGKSDIQWFTNAENSTFVRAVVIVINIWLGFPFFMALITGVMTSIDRSLYEAADIDGASNKDKFRFITFPTIISQTAPLLLMTFSGNFNNFGVIYFVTEGGHGAGDPARAFAGTTDILISWMYNLTVTHRMYHMASVFSILIFLIIGSVSAWNYTRMRAFKED